jgi:hypothetical protein
VRREAAVARISGEEGTIAEIFHARFAEPAGAAGVSKPRDSYPVADPVCGDVAADEVDAADDLVTRNDRIFDMGKLGIEDMKIRPADATRAHLDSNFSVGGHGVRALLHLKRHTGGRKHHRTHLLLRNAPL